MGTMTGAELKAWREGLSLTQSQAGKLLGGASSRTIMRAENEPRAKIARALAQAFDDFQAGKAPVQMTAKAKAAPVPAVEVPPELAAAMLRNPPYATTAAEARAMRVQRALERGLTVGHIRLLPMRPTWARVGDIFVNAAIPNPTDARVPAWAGPRGILTESGDVYDFETAHKMTRPDLAAASVSVAGQW